MCSAPVGLVMSKLHWLSAITAFSVAAPVLTATPESYAKLDKASEAACLKAADLAGATIGPAMRYSDKLPVDAHVVEGTWPQPHMKGAKARMLCLYHRKNKRVEVQEIAAPVAQQTVSVKDVWWRAEDIGGSSVVSGSEVTLMLGSDGKIGGKSGCNGYSANYQVTGDVLKVYPPMIGTRMACPPALMTQERQYRALLENAASVRVTPEGMLVITDASGAASRLVRQ